MSSNLPASDGSHVGLQEAKVARLAAFPRDSANHRHKNNLVVDRTNLYFAERHARGRGILLEITFNRSSANVNAANSADEHGVGRVEAGNPLRIARVERRLPGCDDPLNVLMHVIYQPSR